MSGLATSTGNKAKLRILDLFSGIGGFSLGLERTGGFETVAFCEIKEFPRKVLAKHWPGVPIFHDIRELKGKDVGAVDVICGGFPCQDISFAGKGAGIEGERSGLWSEYARLIGEIRPRYVLVENVAALLGRGLDRVLGDLAALGYDAEWHCIPASAVGAPHRRDRIWIVAYTRSEQHKSSGDALTGSIAAQLLGSAMAYSQGERCGEKGQHSQRSEEWPAGGGHVSDCDGAKFPLSGAFQAGENWEQGWGLSAASDWWSVEPELGRVAHGIPDRAHRLKALGNAVVPQIPELIGRAILEAEASA